MKIVNGRVFVGHGFVTGGVEFDRLIRRVGECVTGEGEYDVRGCYVIPGLIDLHSHGAVGEDASDGSPIGLEKMSLFYAANGVTGWLPTTMTLEAPKLLRVLETMREFTRPQHGARLLGVNLEGPFLSKRKCGSQKPQVVQAPAIGLWRQLLQASNHQIRLMTVAPEVPGCLELIRETALDCVVSVGHTEASYRETLEAFEAGASHISHLYNAMPGVHHRKPGVIGAAFDAGVTVELIADGHHVDPAVVRMTAKLFGEKLVLVSDSGRCTGMPDGEYDLGGQRITLEKGVARLTGTQTLACSAVSLLECVRRAVSFGVPLEDAIYAASTSPARVIRAEQVGSLEPGKYADIVVLDGNLQVKAVFVDGQIDKNF